MSHSIFRYTDQDDDTVGVDARTPSDGREAWLTLRIFEDSLNVLNARAVDIPRDHVLELHAALGEWLYPVHTPEWANKSLIEQMIARAVKDQVAAVLPLHLKPGDRLLVADEDGRVWADPEPHDVGRPLPAVCPRCKQTKGFPHPCDTDPEQQLCKGCAKGSHPHTFAECRHCDCTWTQPEPTEPEPQHETPIETLAKAMGTGLTSAVGRLMSELPRRAPQCVECMHGWGEHTGGICWGNGTGPYANGMGCRCTRERPGTASAAAPECSQGEHKGLGCGCRMDGLR